MLDQEEVGLSHPSQTHFEHQEAVFVGFVSTIIEYLRIFLLTKPEVFPQRLSWQ
jgi:hypothetical protein